MDEGGDTDLRCEFYLPYIYIKCDHDFLQWRVQTIINYKCVIYQLEKEKYFSDVILLYLFLKFCVNFLVNFELIQTSVK